MLDVVWLLLGLFVLLGGGEGLVRGASGLARAAGVPPLVVGLTVVAFGTSAPELAINLTAALSERGGIAFGNVVGSNLANVGLVLGATALLGPLEIRGSVIRREIPLMLLASAATLVMASGEDLRPAGGVLDRSEGLVLFLLFGVFLYGMVLDVLRERRRDALLREAENEERQRRARRVVLDLLLVGVGFAALLGGGRLIVDAATSLALGLGVPEAVVGLTIVAVGTSLPELATAFVAARHDEADLAVGNIVGSNVFNLLFVLALSVLARPLVIPSGGWLDLAASLALSALLLPFATTRRRLARGEGAVLLLAYLAYTAWRSFA